MKTPQILLVDDDPTMLEALSYLLKLRLRGIQVDWAASAIEALQCIQQCDYDAIVSDIMMPGLNVLELLSRIKVLRPTTPTLLITGQTDPGLLQKAMDAGAYDLIQKPLERFALIASINRAVQTHQLQRRVEQQRSLLVSYAQAIGPLSEGAVPKQQPARQSAAPFQPPSWLL